MSFAETVRRFRSDRGLTQEALGAAVGVSGQAVSKWETADAMPDPTLLPALADALGVTIDALFGHEKRTKEKLTDGIRDYLGGFGGGEADRELFDLLSAAFLARPGTGSGARDILGIGPERRIVHLIDRITANGVLWPDDEFPYVALAAEPSGGWASVLRDPAIPEFLALTADPDVLKCVLWLLGEDPKVIETSLLPSKCGADPSRAEEVADKLEKLGAVTLETVQIDGRPRKLADTLPAGSVSFKSKIVAFLAAACAAVRRGTGTQTYTNDAVPPLKNR